MLEKFFLIGPTPLSVETGTYIPALVIISYIVAVLTSYTALDLADHLYKTKHKLWHYAGSFAMGAGIWGMHFIGMLAYKMDMAVSYNPILTILSMIPAIIGSYFVLNIIKTGYTGFLKIISSAVLLGAGICTMHYLGMAAMEMDGGILYKPAIFSLSVLIAIIASGAALTISFLLTHHITQHKIIFKIGSALVMGIAVCGMHYTGMAATIFSPWANCRYDAEQSFEALALSVAAVIFLILTVALFLRVHLEKRTVLDKKTILGLNSSYLTTLFVCLIGFCLSGFGGYFVYETIVKEHEKEFNQSATSHVNSFKNRLDMHSENLQSIKRLYSASSFVDHRDFEIFVAPLLEKYSDITSINFVHEITSGVKGQETYPIIYSEPHNKTKTFTENNFIHHNEIITTIKKSLKKEQIYASHKSISISKNDKENILILSLDVQNNSYFNGAIFAAIDLSKMLQKIEKNGNLNNNDVGIFIEGYTAPSIEVQNPLLLKKNVWAAENSWTINYLKKNDFLGRKQWEVYTVFFGGILLSLIISAYAYTVLRQREKGANLNQALEKEKTHLQAILDNMMQGVITIDNNGTIKTFNKWAERIFDMRANDAIGQNVNILMPEPHHANYTEFLQNYLDTNATNMIDMGREAKGKRKSGEVFPLLISVAKISFNDEAIFVGLIMDITEQKGKEQNLRKTKEEAEQANAAKTDFLANMSHELRTPLNSILGLTRILIADEGTTTDGKEIAETTLKSATNLLDIVNDILDISKIESGNMMIENIGFDLKAISTNVLEAMAPLASSKGISLDIRYEDGESIPYIMGDPFRVNRILTNLIGNAIKYTETGEVNVIFKAHRLEEEQIEIHCAIQDTGIGIPENKLISVFDKFVQADASTTRKYAGTGLGLAITKDLVNIMKGKIGVESIVDKGSNFWFKIPFEITDKTYDHQELSIKSERRKRNRNDDTPLIFAKNARLLVAEDHLLNQAFIGRLLQRMGIGHYDIVENGVLTVERFEKENYDLILMDCHMPEKNGYEATKDIRKSSKDKPKMIPIIALTADAMTGTREKCLASGMNEYVAKPIDADELRHILEEWIIFEEQENNKTTDKKGEKTVPSIDMNLLKEYAETPEDIKNFIGIFLKESDKGITTIAEYCIDGDCKEWVESAHKLKGGSGMIGAKKLHHLCSQAQEMSNVSANDRHQKLQEIQHEYSVVKNELNNSQI
jgi:PAS domain S-box-containing protein